MSGRLPKYWCDMWDKSEQQTDLEKSLYLLSHFCGIYKNLSFLPWKFQKGIGRFFSGRWNSHHVDRIENRIFSFLHPTADITHVYPQTLLNELKQDLGDRPINPNGDLARIFYVIAGKTEANIQNFKENFRNYYGLSSKDDRRFIDITLRVNSATGDLSQEILDLFTDYVGYNEYISRMFQKWNRFISGNWNRHHIDSVSKVVNACIGDGNEPLAFDQVEFLKRLKAELISAGKELNLDGDLAKRIIYAQQFLKLKNKIQEDIIDLDSINQEILSPKQPLLK